MVSNYFSTIWTSIKLHALAKSRARTEFSFETSSCELTLVSLISNFNVLNSCNGEFHLLVFTGIELSKLILTSS